MASWVIRQEASDWSSRTLPSCMGSGSADQDACGVRFSVALLLQGHIGIPE